MKINKQQTSGQEIVIKGNAGNPAISNNQCCRCYAKIERWMHGPDYKYCWTCYQMGSVTEHNSLIAVPETNDFPVADNILVWNGTLTPQQQIIADKLCAEEQANQLVHAVTGAGKTEMLYLVIEKALREKKRVSFVAPRVDVIHEIAKRMSSVFSVSQTTMTGDTTDIKGHYQFVFATIHQLFKFKDAFDVIIVDECDAFPLYKNKWLYGAITKALKADGRLICLTATLPRGLAKSFNIPIGNTLALYRRFHGHPLPNLQIRYCGNWRKKCPKEMIQLVMTSQFPLLIFVPNISDCHALKVTLEMITKKLVGVAYAGGENRLDNIQAFKDGKLNVLVTTILLERGITFPGIDVIIVGADEAVFSTSTLVQIAGRCGRSVERPTGNVYVYTRWKSRKIKKAYDEIARMNK